MVGCQKGCKNRGSRRGSLIDVRGESNSPSGTLQIRVFSSLTVSFSLPMISRSRGNGQYDLLPGLAADLVRRQVAVIVASGGPPPALAARAATFTVPIVFSSVDEPIKLGLIASLNRPGSNATGMSLFRKELVSKQLELLRDMVPKAEVIAVLVNPANRQSDGYILYRVPKSVTLAPFPKVGESDSR